MTRVLALVLALATGCGKDPPDRVVVTNRQVAIAEHLLAIFVDLSHKLDHATDCKQATEALVTARTEFEKIAAEAGHLADQALANPTLGAWMQQYMTKVGETMQYPLQNRTYACHEDEAYMDAVKHLPLVKHK